MGFVSDAFKSEEERLINAELKFVRERYIAEARVKAEEEVKEEIERIMKQKMQIAEERSDSRVNVVKAEFLSSFAQGKTFAKNGKILQIRELYQLLSQVVTINGTKFGYAIGYLVGIIDYHPEIILQDQDGFKGVINSLKKPVYMGYREFLLRKTRKARQLRQFCSLLEP